MRVDRLSVSFEAELAKTVRAAAAQGGKLLSSWLAEAAASKLRAEALTELLATWEAEHGVLTTEEIARAERELGLPAADRAAWAEQAPLTPSTPPSSLPRPATGY